MWGPTEGGVLKRAEKEGVERRDGGSREERSCGVRSEKVGVRRKDGWVLGVT